MTKKPDQELPEAGNQKAIENSIKEMLGPPPNEATHSQAEAIRSGSDAQSVAANGLPETPESVIPAAGEADSLPDDPATNQAVDEIVAQEGDAALAVEDQAAAPPPAEKPTLKTRLKRFLRAWWHNKRARYATLFGLGLTLIGLGVWPTSRYFILNNVGVRSSASLTVLDQTSNQPVKNVRVSLSNQSGVTDANGRLKLEHLKLGRTELKLEKRAYATETRPITVGWGSNPLQTIALKAVGTQYVINATDWLSGKGIGSAVAVSGEFDGQADEAGKITIAFDKAAQDRETAEVEITATGYRTEKIVLDLNADGDAAVQLVPGRKSLFISSRDGRQDLYKVDADGENEKLILKGTGREADDTALVPHPTDEVAALMSARDNVKNADGYSLRTLTYINLANDDAKMVTQAERISVLGWIDHKLLYIQTTAGTSAASPNRNTLVAYDYKTGAKKVLFSTNYFNDAFIIGSNLYYAPNAAFQSTANIGLFKITAEGGNKQTITAREVSYAERTAYDSLQMFVGDGFYEFKLGDSQITKLNPQPDRVVGRFYVDNPSRKLSAWVDERDGKGVLLAYDISSKNERTVTSQSILNPEIRWLNETTLVYRLQGDGEAADYAVSTEGGEPKKIRDVTAVGGVRSGPYY